MNKRPVSITVIGCVFVCVGCGSLIAGVWRFIGDRAHVDARATTVNDVIDMALVSGSALLAVVGGMFVLHGCHWARWLLFLWLAAHVVLSLCHSAFELIVHSLLLVIVLHLLFRQQAATYFRDTMTEPTGRDLTKGGPV